jgi:hypothetical protein
MREWMLFASALEKLLDRIASLLDQRGDNLLCLRIVERAPFFHLSIHQCGLHHPQRREPRLIFRFHGRGHRRRNVIDQRHVPTSP